MLTPVTLFKCLADETRLRCLLLLLKGELCVCELTRALALSQPKISRHLAQLRACRVVADRRRGLWVYYRLHDQLPAWALAVLHAAAESMADDSLHRQDGLRLHGAAAGCCESEPPPV
ncbi:MAG TPA: metalloregulator ArsR/SmtB family transcription factor [Methylococcaceae bacterium]|nr:metalloregulator ArsR/SmtB family transcription factor [Methylococcaceae bacterium]